MHQTHSDATTQGLSGPGSDGSEGVLHIPQSSSITGTSPSDCLVSYSGHLLEGVLTLYRDAVSVFYSRLVNICKGRKGSRWREEISF